MTDRARLLDAHLLDQRETGNETDVRGLLSGLALVMTSMSLLRFTLTTRST